MTQNPQPSFLKQVAIAICIWAAIIAFMLGSVYVETAPQRKEALVSIFSTPPDEIDFSSDAFPGACNHGSIDFLATAKYGKLALRSDRTYREIDITSGQLGKNFDSWAKHCYFQAGDPYLTGINGDLWIYTDDRLSRAHVVGHCRAYANIATMRQEFEKIFDYPFDALNFGEDYQRDNRFYFHVYAPMNTFRFKEGCELKSLDLNKSSPPIDFPPRQRKEPWMTKCYHLVMPAAAKTPREQFWIFLDDKSIETFVIGQYEKTEAKNP
jgi:hypothetical protein